MIDNFFGGITDEMKAVLDALAKQNQQQQEPQTSTDRVNDEVFQGAEANKAAFNQQQAAQQLQPLAPDQYYYGNQIAQAKGAYENADALARQLNPNVTDENQLNALADQLRNNSHQFADNIRQITKALGTDLSGIEDVSYADAARNLQTRQAKEVVDIMSGQGKYGRKADRYYDDEYMALIGEGYSARNARRIAGERAQRYQADRVTYLRNAFNMYGRDGNYINDSGMAMIQEIAGEMPEVAQVYWGAYKHPDQAQDRLETVYDKERGYQNAFEVANQNFLHNAALTNLTVAGNRLLESDRHENREKEAESQFGRNKDLYSWQKDEDFRLFAEKEKFKNVQEINVAYAKFKTGQRIAAEIGLKGDAANSLAVAFAGVQIPKQGGKLDNKSVENLEKIAKTYDESEKNILSQLNKENLNLSDEEIAELTKTLNYVREQKAKIQKALLGTVGMDGETSDNATSLNKDLKHDLPILQGAYAEAIRRNYTHDKAIEFLRNRMEKAGYAGTQIEAVIGTLAR